MNTVTIKIDGMMCGMCEAHICDAIRHLYPNAKKVKASRTRKTATFLTEETPDTEKIAKAITDTGYTFLSAEYGPYRKTGLFRRS